MNLFEDERCEKCCRIERVSNKTRRKYKQWVFVGWHTPPNLRLDNQEWIYDGKYLIIKHNDIEWDRYRIGGMVK